MKRAPYGIVRASSWFTRHAGAGIIAWAVVWMGAAPRPAWGQWSGGPTGPVYYNGGNVGIGTSGPDAGLVLYGSNGFRVTGSGLANFYVTPISGTTVLGTADSSHLELRTSNTARLVILNGGNVGIGIGSPQYKLSVNGAIGAKQVIVTNTGWPDYVFRPGYRLRPLSEVGAYIRAHRRLPDIPSEAEVKGEGVNVGEMQAKLLAKIEELTLHLIQQEQRIAQLEARLAGR